MKNIDFLPEIYRHRQVLRSARLWWGGVAAVFGLAIGGTAAAQWYLRHRLDAQLAMVEPLYLVSLQRNAEMTSLQTRISQADDLVSLYLYLDHPWPRTQILAAVAAPLPPSIRLSELRLSEDAITIGSSAASEDVNRSAENTKTEAQPTAKTELARLRAEYDRKKTVLELSGQASSIEQLHAYVDALAKSPLVASANLTGLESGKETTGAAGTRFHVRIVIRPGYGQPGGQHANAAPVTHTESSPEDRALARTVQPERGGP